MLLKYYILLIMFWSISVISAPIVGGYYTNWDVYSGYTVANNPQLEHQVAISNTMYYAFFFVARSGQISFSDPWSDLSSTNPTDVSFCKMNTASCPGFSRQHGGYGNFGAFTSLRVSRRIVSVGGGSSAGVQSFNNAFAHISTFVSSLQALQRSYDFNGIDLDFEPSSMTKSQAASFVKLVTAIHTAMPDLTITYPIPAYLGFLQRFSSLQWNVIQRNISYIMIMGYDMVGPWTNPPITALQSDLRQDKVMVSALNAIGWPTERIILGVPGYLAVLGGVATEGLGIRFNPRSYSTPNYNTFMYANSLPVINFTDVNDQIDGAYVYNPSTKTFSTFDSIQSMATKTTYCQQQGLAGIVMWSLSMDLDPSDSNSLLNVMKGVDNSIETVVY